MGVAKSAEAFESSCAAAAGGAGGGGTTAAGGGTTVALGAAGGGTAAMGACTHQHKFRSSYCIDHVKMIKHNQYNFNLSI